MRVDGNNSNQQRSSEDRSTFTKAITGTALLGGVAKGLAVDRPRIVAALPHAYREQKLGKWALELVTGTPTHDVVPIHGGTVKLLGRTLTHDGWGKAFGVSNALAATVLGATLTYGIPNTWEAFSDAGGASGLWESKAGRTGMFAMANAAFELGVLAFALRHPLPGKGRLESLMTHPVQAETSIAATRMAFSAPVMANELGYLDFADAGNDASVVDNALDRTQQLLASLRRFLTNDVTVGGTATMPTAPRANGT